MMVKQDSKPNKSFSSKEIVQLAYRPILPYIIHMFTVDWE